MSERARSTRSSLLRAGQRQPQGRANSGDPPGAIRAMVRKFVRTCASPQVRANSGRPHGASRAMMPLLAGVRCSARHCDGDDGWMAGWSRRCVASTGLPARATAANMQKNNHPAVATSVHERRAQLLAPPPQASTAERNPTPRRPPRRPPALAIPRKSSSGCRSDISRYVTNDTSRYDTSRHDTSRYYTS